MKEDRIHRNTEENDERGKGRTRRENRNMTPGKDKWRTTKPQMEGEMKDGQIKKKKTIVR